MPILTASERTGTLLGGRYRIEGLLGEGGFGGVFRATHTVTSRAVALKILHPHLVENEAMAQRFLQEAQAMARLRHPGIVQVLDAGRDDDGTVFLALELLEGETLEARLHREKQLAVDVALDLCAQVLAALAVAHAHDIVHRDIKPANIFLSHEGDGTLRATLIDFGIAHVVPKEGAKMTGAGLILGTPEYMSPEQARANAVGPGADLWSVGIVLYEMLTGLVPWTHESAAVVLMAVASEPLPDLAASLAGVPAAVVKGIARALEKDPAVRFQSAEEMRGALRREAVPRSPSGERAAVRSASATTMREFELDAQSHRALDLDPSGAGATTRSSLVPAAPPTRSSLAPLPPAPDLPLPPPPEAPHAKPATNRAAPSSPVQLPRALRAVSPSVVGVSVGITAVVALALFLWLRPRADAARAASLVARDAGVPVDVPSVPEVALPTRALVERFHIAVPFGIDADGARAFAAHATLGPAGPAGTVRSVATCVRDTVYLYAGGDGSPIGSSQAPIACGQSDVAVIPDQDGDGADDLAAVSRDHHAILVLTTRHLQLARTFVLPGVTSLAGIVRTPGAALLVVYVERDDAASPTALLAIDVHSGQLAWQETGTAPLLRVGQPGDLGIAIGDDATGDGVPDVAVGIGPMASLPADQLPARSRCVELLDGATGRHVWSAPFCQMRGGAQSVSLGPDVDGDGHGDVAVGSDLVRGTDGHVVLVSGATGALIRRVIVPASLHAGAMGWPVSLGPDVDGDATPDLAVGSLGNGAHEVLVLSGRDGHLVARRGVSSATAFPSLRVELARGVLHGDGAALLLAAPDDGVRAFVVGEPRGTP